jgi:hypothetical protein
VVRASRIRPAVAARARAALAAYRSRERNQRHRAALPALRPLIVTPEAAARWTAIAITRRGELYLIVELEQTRRGVVVTGWR